MGTTTCLQDSIKHAHDELGTQLATARTVMPERGHSRRGCPPIDLYLVGSSRHLHAVDDVLVPAVEHGVPGGRSLVRDYETAAHRLAVVLAHVKALEYGSTWEHGLAWAGVWDDVEGAATGQRRHEEAVGEELSQALGEERLQRLADRLEHAQGSEPTRPHPYVPHRGPAGRVARWVTRRSDGFWDTVESRYTPERPHVEHKRPGLLWQYLLADPHFDDEDADIKP